jgi:hypothetical protein
LEIFFFLSFFSPLYNMTVSCRDMKKGGKDEIRWMKRMDRWKKGWDGWMGRIPSVDGGIGQLSA